MGDIILWESLYNKRNMQRTIEERGTTLNSSFKTNIIYNNNISPDDKANYIRRLFDWDTEKPFPMVQFAKSLGVDVFVEDLRGLNEGTSLKGYLAIKPNGNAVIVVSENESYGHQRWTVAHELWHYFNHRAAQSKETIFFAEHDDYDADDRDPEECDADQFATSLLMPADEFRDIYAAYSADKKNDAKNFLADYFAVSQIAVSKRIEGLAL